MKKLILKAKLTDLETFMRRIEMLGGEMLPTTWQHERVYAAHDFKPNFNQPRLIMRTEVIDTEQPPAYSMHLKRHIEDSGIDIVYSTPITDYTSTSGIIHQLGFRKLNEISRQRQEISIDPKIKLYLDTVEKLPIQFVKIETELGEETPVTALREQLKQILTSLSLEDFTEKTYAEMLA